jgi:hypothetical protein
LATLAGLLLLVFVFETGWRALVYESVDAGEVSLPSNLYIFLWWTFILYIVRVGLLFFPFSPLMREEIIHENPTSP